MTESDMQHGVRWTGCDLAGWHATEKLDGVRVYWDGSQAWTRGGLLVQLPRVIRDDLPPDGAALDCELYAGPGRRTLCTTAARYGRFDPAVTLVAFDAPNQPGDLVERLSGVWIGPRSGRVWRAPVWTVSSTAEALQLLRTVLASGGEGLMCAAPGAPYTRARTSDLVKVKREALQLEAVSA